jgi:hypothetical protein
MCVGLVDVDVLPSPKFQRYDVAPLLVLLNWDSVPKQVEVTLKSTTGNAHTVAVVLADAEQLLLSVTVRV